MQCDDVAPLLLPHMEGRLESEARLRLDRHLEQCEACRETLEAQRLVASVLSARPVAEAPLGFAGRVMADLEPVPGWLDVLNWRVWTFRLAPVAAALVVVAVLGFGPTEAAEPLEFSDLVAEWVVEDDADELPAFSLLWQEEVTDDTLLEAVLSAVPDEPF
jgi:anti-sigma factor RsiW